jgi:tetratricopeptide (TPR) repeat protein
LRDNEVFHFNVGGDVHMKRLIPAWGMLAITLVFAAIAAAQGTGRLNGQILDKDGNPWEGLTIEIKNPDTGALITLHTDKDGKFIQIGLKGAIYNINVISQKDNMTYPVKYQVVDGQENVLKLNFKDIIAETLAAHPEEATKKSETENKFKMMKMHFDAGIAAMNDSGEVGKQLKTAPADQRSALQQKKLADCETAITEFKQAEQGVGPKEINNHAMFLGNLGQAYDCAGHHEDAAASFQKAIDLKPQANYYFGLSTSLANVAVGQTDPKVTEAKVAEASANCDKAGALDPATGATCWRNLGIVLSNKGKSKEAVAPLQKATQTDPKDAQAWFLLGGALAAQIDSKQEGDKMVYIVPPGTKEAYEKCIEIAPGSPIAAEAKAALVQLTALSGGDQVRVTKKKKG